MDEENNFSIVATLQSLAQTFFKALADAASLVGAEALLAGKSLINIVVLIVVMRILAIITWLCLCGSLAVYLAQLTQSWSISLLALALVNFIALFAVYLMQLKLKKNLSFPATRRQLLNSVDKGPYHEQPKIEGEVS